MKIALIGTRGVPARYGGFETAVEEVGRRLVERGHEVTVYCRHTGAARNSHYAGMRLVHLPALRHRSLETLTHSGLSILHHLIRGRSDVVVVFNAANALFLPLLHLRRTPTATHVDGLEWRRAKWGRLGQSYYRLAESLAVRWSDGLIADAAGIGSYYAEEFGAQTHHIAYGAPILDGPGTHKLATVGVTPQSYHLIVARFEPENHVDLAIEGYRESTCQHPLVVVGSAPYRSAHVERIESLATADGRVRLIGGVWDQEALDQLYAHARTYIHGHSVGGTNPSLLRAMGAAAATVAYDVEFNREVLGDTAQFFHSAKGLARQLEQSESGAEAGSDLGERAQRRAAQTYTWEAVAKDYERLCTELLAGASQRGRASGRRLPSSSWAR